MDRVYANGSQTTDILKIAIAQRIQEDTPSMLKRFSTSMRKKVQLYFLERGGYFERLL